MTSVYIDAVFVNIRKKEMKCLSVYVYLYVYV